MRTKSVLTGIHAVIVALCISSWNDRAAAVPVISGSVTSDPAGLYTYSYTIDNTSGTAAVFEFSVLVFWQYYPTPLPVEWQYPTGWQPSTACCGTIALPPYNLVGDLWGFFATKPTYYVPAGESLTGFSFSTYSPPYSWQPNNYFVYDLGVDLGGTINIGTTVAPFYVGIVPEPSTWAMMLIGFAGIGFVTYRRSRKNTMALTAA